MEMGSQSISPSRAMVPACKRPLKPPRGRVAGRRGPPEWGWWVSCRPGQRGQRGQPAVACRRATLPRCMAYDWRSGA